MQTYRNYPVLEVALAGFHGGNDRVTLGDIVVVRPPLAGVGLKEMHGFIWLRLKGFDLSVMERFIDLVENGDKRQFQIPFARLKSRYGAFDPGKAADQSVVYQPFLPIDEDTGIFLQTAALPPLECRGLVLDKNTRRFL